MFSKKELNYLFPELKESEDEKIRKAILNYFTKCWGNCKDDVCGIHVEDAINWLEKQCEQKTQVKSAIEIWKDMRFEVYQQASGNRHEPNYSDDSSKIFSLNDIDKIIEKMSEQKLADKAEPKFQEGDWITDGNITIQIEAIKNNCYLYCGDCALYSTKTADKVYHLWTIQDAKPGDVLYSPAHNILWIYKDKEQYYASINLNYADFISLGADIVIPSDVHPATKEQRDLLFQKIKEAGYEWDIEKK